MIKALQDVTGLTGITSDLTNVTGLTKFTDLTDVTGLSVNMDNCQIFCGEREFRAIIDTIKEQLRCSQALKPAQTDR